MGNCEYCGAAVEEGALCPCASARETATPPAKPEIPPEGAQGPAGGYPSYPYRVEEAPPEALRQPQAEYPPYFVPAQPPGGYVWPGYAPPGYPAPDLARDYQPYARQGCYAPFAGYGPCPWQAQQQRAGAVRHTLGSFLKDPYGMAAKGGSLSLSVSMVLLGIQASAFFLMALADLAQVDFWGTDAVFWLRTAVLGVIGIAILYSCIFVASKIAKIIISPGALLSAQALSSLPLSAMYLLTALFSVIFGGTAGLFAQALVQALGSVASLLLLEVSLRAVMPSGVGNMVRLGVLTCCCALANALVVVSSSEMIGMAFPFFFSCGL